MAMKSLKVSHELVANLTVKDDEKLKENIARMSLAIKDEDVNYPVSKIKKNISSLALGLAIGAGLDYLLDTDEPLFTIAGYKLAEAGLENKYNNKHKPKTTNTKSELNKKNVEYEIESLSKLSFFDD